MPRSSRTSSRHAADAAEVAQRRAPRLLRAHALLLAVFGFHRDVDVRSRADLGVERSRSASDRRRPSISAHGGPLGSTRCGLDSVVVLSTRATAAVMRSQFSVSTCELALSGPGQPVELGFAVVVGHAPLGGDPALLLEPVQRRIERALVDAQDVLRRSAESAARCPSRAAARAPASAGSAGRACPAANRSSVASPS